MLPATRNHSDGALDAALDRIQEANPETLAAIFGDEVRLTDEP